MGVEELIIKINEIRKYKGYLTNAFFTLQQLKSKLSDFKITVETSDNIVLIMIEEEQLVRLYFYVTSYEELKKIKYLISKEISKPVILDIVGKETQLEQIVSNLQKSSFSIYRKMIRMHRTKQECLHTNGSISDVKFATPDKLSEIMDILYKEFDLYVSHLPTYKKVINAIENKEILVITNQGKIIGLAYFEKVGKKLEYLYQLVVNKEFRGRGVADNLLVYKFNTLTTDVTYQLWVESNNSYAIKKYTKYNFIPDGLIDFIMIYEESHYGKDI